MRIIEKTKSKKQETGPGALVANCKCKTRWEWQQRQYKGGEVVWNGNCHQQVGSSSTALSVTSSNSSRNDVFEEPFLGRKQRTFSLLIDFRYEYDDTNETVKSCVMKAWHRRCYRMKLKGSKSVIFLTYRSIFPVK